MASQALLLPPPPTCSPFLSLRRPPREACRVTTSASPPPPPSPAVSTTPLGTLRLSGLGAAGAELELALAAFTREPKPSPFLYNSLIRALNRAGHPGRALSVFRHMLHDLDSLPDRFTFPFALKSCAQLAALEVGEQIHGLVFKAHEDDDDDDGVFVANALIHLYSQCGRIDRASKVFDRLLTRNVVSWNSIIDGFAKCGDVVSARLLFDEMPGRNVVSWNSMIGGYVHNGLPDEALRLFFQLQRSVLDPDKSTLVSAVSAISDLGLLDLGKRVHGYIIRCGFSMHGALGVSLITMYTRCGRIDAAYQVFSDIPNKNVAHWTAMIVGCAAHGLAEDSLRLFAEMLTSGVKPNYITFMGVLNACSHRGLLEEGLTHFNLMRAYGVQPCLQHYGCLVDLLSRSGLFEEALMVIGHLPEEPGPVVWGTLLAACRNHGKADIAEMVASKLMDLEPDYGGSYVLLSNVYASLGKWDDFSNTRKMMKDRGVGKVPGISWIEVDGDVHEFVMGDRFHPKCREMYNLLGMMECHLNYAGSYFTSRMQVNDATVDV